MILSMLDLFQNIIWVFFWGKKKKKKGGGGLAITGTKMLKLLCMYSEVFLTYTLLASMLAYCNWKFSWLKLWYEDILIIVSSTSQHACITLIYVCLIFVLAVSIVMFLTFEHSVDLIYSNIMQRRKVDCSTTQQLGVTCLACWNILWTYINQITFNPEFGFIECQNWLKLIV